MDSWSTTDHRKQEILIKKHIAELRLRAEYRTVPIIFVPENQTGYFHTRVEEYARDIPNCHVLHERGGHKPGIHKTKEVTADYVTRTAFALDERMIMIDHKWVCTTHEYKQRGRKGVLDEFKQQLMRYGYDEKGKLTGKYGAFNDDGAIAFMMFIYWSTAVERKIPGNPYANLQFGLARVSHNR